MDDRKRNLIGSPARDAFKHWHKQRPFPRNFYALDIDFVLVTKWNGAGIVAIIDFKLPNDRLTFAEVIAYNHFASFGIEVYIVTAKWDQENQEEPFADIMVEKYLGGDWKPEPPICKMELIAGPFDTMGYIRWEGILRAKWGRAGDNDK